MSVEQYAAKFIELSRFAPYLITTEELKAKKFEKGLHLQILDRVAGFELNNLADLISKASVGERTWKTNVEFYNQQKKRVVLQGNRTSGHHNYPNKRRNNHQVGCNPTPQGAQGGNGPCPNCPKC
jgi:hypothetical protein